MFLLQYVQSVSNSRKAQKEHLETKKMRSSSIKICWLIPDTFLLQAHGIVHQVTISDNNEPPQNCTGEALYKCYSVVDPSQFLGELLCKSSDVMCIPDAVQLSRWLPVRCILRTCTCCSDILEKGAAIYLTEMFSTYFIFTSYHII